MTTNEALKALKKEPLVTRLRTFAAQLDDLSADLEDDYNRDAAKDVMWLLPDLCGIIEICDAIEPVLTHAIKEAA